MVALLYFFDAHVFAQGVITVLVAIIVLVVGAVDIARGRLKDDGPQLYPSNEAA